MGWFLTNFLRDRHFRVRIGSTLSDRFPQRSGVPQGGILSVVLFTVMVNDVENSLTPGIGHSLFVDDVAIWVTASSSSSATRQLQLNVQRVSNWGDENGFAFSAEKTCCVHFCNRKRECPDPSLRLYGKDIPVVRSCRFLGVLLDRRLTYVDHMKSLREKCLRAMAVLKVVSRMSYGADRKTMLLLYRALIRSKLEYACPIYDSALDSSKKMLDTVHHHGIRIATGAFRTSPIASILADADEPPLALRRRLLSLRYATSIKQFPSHPAYEAIFSNELLHSFLQGASRGSQPFCRRLDTWLREAGLDMGQVLTYTPRRTEPWLTHPLQIDTSLTRFSKGATQAEELRQEAEILIYDMHQNSAHFYTDGSKTSHGTGSAYHSSHGCGQTPLPQMATVFTAELVAILCCLERIAQLNNANSTIFTDSLSSVQLLHPTCTAYSPYRDLILEKADGLRKAGKNVAVVWIPAHVGIPGNEAADSAAKSAALLSPDPCIKVPARDMRAVAKRYIISEWQKTWDREPPNNKLKEIRAKLGAWSSSDRRSRVEEVILARLRIGHCYSTHGYLLSRNSEATPCRLCGHPLSVRHVLVECDGLSLDRRSILGGERQLSSLIGEFPEVEMGKVTRFLRSAGLRVIYCPT